MRRPALTVVALLVGCAAGVAFREVVFPARAASGPTYAYKIVAAKDLIESVKAKNPLFKDADSRQLLEEGMRGFGSGGWRYAGCLQSHYPCDHLIFESGERRRISAAGADNDPAGAAACGAGKPDESMSKPEYTIDDAARAEAREVGERARKWRDGRGVDTTGLARLHAWLRYAVVYHSNALEGGGLTETEARAVLVDGLTVGKPLRDHLWAVNLSVAAERVEKWALEPSAISETQILEINAVLLRGIDELGAGSYRKVAVYLTGASFEPPPPEAVPSQMAELYAWLSAASDDVEPIVFAAEMHAWFETIHPFVDGNGRAGRLLVDLSLLKRGLIRALVRAEERDRYRDALRRAQSLGELTPLVRLFSDSVGKMLAEHERASQPR